WTPTGSGSSAPPSCSRRSGRPRTTTWPGRWSTPSCRRTTCSRAFASASPSARVRRARSAAELTSEARTPGGRLDGVTVIAVAEGDVSPGVLGFLVVAALGLALYLLVKSMNKQISKIEVPSEAELKAEMEAKRRGESNDQTAESNDSDKAR